MWGQKFTLEGEVLDGSNKSPLAFANVILEGTSLGSASDNEGRFRIENIEAGTYTIFASYMGYSTFKKDKMFSQIKRKINDCWDALMNSIIHQPEVDFLNEIITNLQVGKKNQNNFN